MTAIIKNKFRVQSAKHFLENFESVAIRPASTSNDDITNYVKRPQNYYLFVGKPFTWDSTNTDTNRQDELNPPFPVDSDYSEARVWDEMLGLKQITKRDVSLVVPRSNWTPNTVYVPFDDKDGEKFRHPTITERNNLTTATAGNFYVLNRMFDLFICINNNNSAVSAKEPTRPMDITKSFTEDDGYVWKYMTSITSGDAVKFMTDAWIPVRTIVGASEQPQKVVQDAAAPGELIRTVVTTGTGSFSHIYSGSVQLVTQSNPTDQFNAALSFSGSDEPPVVSNVYVGYQLHITGPSTVVESGANIPNPLLGTVLDVTAYVLNNTTPIITTQQNLVTIGVKPGVSYTCQILPTLKVQTNGTEVKLRPVMDANKNMSRVDVLSGGANATSIVITVVPPPTFSGTTPTVRAILGPPHGIGADPENDLGAFYVMLSTQLRNEEGAGDFPVANDYRQIGVVKSVKKLVSGVETLATETTLIATKTLIVRYANTDATGSAKLGFAVDEVVKLESSSGADLGRLRVVQCTEPETKQLSNGTSAIQSDVTYIQTEYTGFASVSELNFIKGLQTSGAAVAQIISGGVVNEELIKFRGEILCLENRRPVLRASDQLEDIKMIIEF